MNVCLNSVSVSYFTHLQKAVCVFRCVFMCVCVCMGVCVTCVYVCARVCARVYFSIQYFTPAKAVEEAQSY